MKRNLLTVLFGIVGVLLALVAVHLYQDHQNFHVVLNYLVAQQQMQQKAVGK